MVPRRRALAAGLPRRVEGARMPGLTADPSAGAPGAALASDPHTAGADHAGLA